MIRIDRDKFDQDGQPIIPSQQWFQRSHAAREQAIKQKKADQSLDRIYGDKEIRACLSAIFSNKCAYCEYPLTRTDLNVEHYRPKARVHESPEHPGYYWLACEWSNLLPACQHCNQLRKDPPMWREPRQKDAKGKGDKFPLADEANRAFSPTDSIENEQPLLINPTVEEPSKHIKFDPLGKPLPISKRGQVSIETYNLDTHLLNDQRRTIIQEMIGLLEWKAEIPERFSKPTTQQQALAEIEAWISKRTNDSASYAAAARAVINNPMEFGL